MVSYHAEPTTTKKLILKKTEKTFVFNFKTLSLCRFQTKIFYTLKFKIMQFNWLVVFATGIIPLLTGFLWYNPKTFANAWMKAADITEEKMKDANMAKIFGFALLFGMFLAVAVTQLVVHQTHYYSILADTAEMKDANSAISLSTKNFYGYLWR